MEPPTLHSGNSRMGISGRMSLNINANISRKDGQTRNDLSNSIDMSEAKSKQGKLRNQKSSL